MIVTDQDDCFNGTLPEDDDEEINFEKLILKISALTSLICLTLTVIVYIIFPSPDTRKEKNEKERDWFLRAGCSSVIFVPYTPEDRLAKKLRATMERIMGGRGGMRRW